MSEPISASGVSIPRRRRWLSGLGVGVVVLLVGAGIGWAGATVLTPAQDVLDSTAFTYVEVVPGEVGSSISLNTAAEWTPVPVGSNQASGTVTTVRVGPGDEVKQGSVLYTVDLRPVVIAEGAIPAFRALASGASGSDVTQLQALLKAIGRYSGPADGRFGYGTSVAVKAWQKSLGVYADGVVQLGDVIFVPSLPTRVALDATVIERGASVTGGEPVVTGLPPQPTFTVPVTDSQASLMPIGTRVEIANGELVWEGFVVDHESHPERGTTVILEGKDGASICGEDCGTIPVTGQTLLLSKIVTVETVSGLVVPSAALLSAADGTVSVIDAEGVNHPVTVLTSARGMSVIEGVSAGMKVRIPAASG